MFSKKHLVAAALVMASGTALAEQVPFSIQVEAVVPSANFYVTPFGSNWINSPVALIWNPTAGELMPATKQFEMMSSLGGIKASVTNLPKLAAGSDLIDLQVSVGGKTLSTTPVEVLTSAEASTAKRQEFKIAATKPGSGFKPGSYTGNIELMFESTTP